MAELPHVLFHGVKRLIMLSARERSTKADTGNPFRHFYTLWVGCGHARQATSGQKQSPMAADFATKDIPKDIFRVA